MLNLLTGDAGQRAIAAWHMGWPTAQTISGTDWMAPQLAILLEDPYDAVRYIANRSLATLPAYEQWSFDFLDSPQKRAEAKDHAVQVWKRMHRDSVAESNPSVLLGEGANLERGLQQSLIRRRSNRDVYLRE